MSLIHPSFLTVILADFCISLKMAIFFCIFIRSESYFVVSLCPISSSFCLHPVILFPFERLLLNHAKTPGFLASGGEEFNPGLDRSELLCNKVLLKYKGDRESF